MGLHYRDKLGQAYLFQPDHASPYAKHRKLRIPTVQFVFSLGSCPSSSPSTAKQNVRHCVPPSDYINGTFPHSVSQKGPRAQHALRFFPWRSCSARDRALFTTSYSQNVRGMSHEVSRSARLRSFPACNPQKNSGWMAWCGTPVPSRT